jgi:hypothetical protein
LFFLLVPGFIVTLPPGSSIMTAAAVHALIFFLILQYLSLYVPWWAIWVVGVSTVSYKAYYGV